MFHDFPLLIFWVTGEIRLRQLFRGVIVIPLVHGSKWPPMDRLGNTRDRDLAVTHLWQVLERLQEVPHPVSCICYLDLFC